MPLRIIILFFICLINQQVFSQVNIMGKPGYINTPSAAWIEGRPLGFSFSYLPGAYSMFGKEKKEVNFYNVRADLTTFMEVNLSIAYRPARAEMNNLGVGDRQLDFRFRLLKEKKYWPAVVLGWTPPGSAAPYLAHDYLVITKTFHSNIGKFQLSTGYGSPYVFIKKQHAGSFLDFKIEKKVATRLNANYLSGFFTAFTYRPFAFGGLMAEYDSNTINAGAYIQPWEWLYLQGYTYEGKEWAYSLALNFSLDFSPKSLRKYEESQD